MKDQIIKYYYYSDYYRWCKSINEEPITQEHWEQIFRYLKKEG